MTGVFRPQGILCKANGFIPFKPSRYFLQRIRSQDLSFPPSLFQEAQEHKEKLGVCGLDREVELLYGKPLTQRDAEDDEVTAGSVGWVLGGLASGAFDLEPRNLR